MKKKNVDREVTLIIPMFPNMELAAAQTAAGLAELMSFEEDNIDEIKLAIIETCLNAFEHSQSQDKKVYIEFIMRREELEFRITDRGVGFQLDQVTTPSIEEAMHGGRRRGWGLLIIRDLMDKVDVISGEDGTTITMIKRKIKATSACRAEPPSEESDEAG